METMPFTYFERHWSLGKNWALLVLPPERLASTPSELEHMQAASRLESSGQISAAKIAYEAILGRWPRSYTAHVGMGNVAFQEQDYKRAPQYLSKAVELNPSSKAASHNLSVVRKLMQAKVAE
ncbi:MAG: tetratricopeptide repeat protein [Oligoflexales bacterium]|nr:tetratricopeptide repeat protein [Oligoflexales bacterium]